MRRVLFLAAAALALCTPAEALHVVSPAPGTVVKPGDLVDLVLALDPGEASTNVGVMSDGQAVQAMQDGPVWRGKVRIATETVGGDLLVGYAVLTGGGVAFADVQVTVDAGAVRSLFLDVPLKFTHAGETAGVEVRGLFVDNVLRDLSDPALGTTYSSSDSTVLAVDAGGVVQARSSGDAVLTVTSGGHEVTAKIQVRIPASDTNRIPTITPGADQLVPPQHVVVLHATATDPDGDAIEYLWEQTAGRVVTLHNPRSDHPEFASPRVTTPQVLEFLVAARDAKGATTLPVVVRVTVDPAAPVEAP